MQQIRPISGTWLACCTALLLDLDERDRRLRFGAMVDDDAIEAHMAGLAARGVRVLAAFADGRVDGAVEIAPDGAAVEIAIVVAPRARRQGLGFRLLTAGLAATGAAEARLQMTADNRASRRLAVRAGFVLRGAGTEIVGVRALERRNPRPSLAAA